MLEINSDASVYFATGPTDLRKSIDGLSILVAESFNLDPFQPALFVFCNRNKDKIKILKWDHNGFWLYYKRLEKGTFKWPNKTDEKVIGLTQRNLRWLLDGLSIHQHTAHKAVHERLII